MKTDSSFRSAIKMAAPDAPNTVEGVQVAIDLREAVGSYLSGRIGIAELREAADLFDLWYLSRGEPEIQRLHRSPRNSTSQCTPGVAVLSPRKRHRLPLAG